MALGNKTNAISKFGGSWIFFREVDPDTGLDLATPATDFEIGHCGDFELDQNVDVEEVYERNGRLVTIIEGQELIKYVGNALQSDKELLDFLSQGCRGKVYRIIADNGINIGNYQELVIGKAIIKPGMKLKDGDKKPPIEIYLLNNSADLVIASANLPVTKMQNTGADITITAHSQFAILEKAVT